MKTYNCPKCDEEHTLDENQVRVTCLECQSELWLEADGEFRDGHWRDLSRLVRYETDGMLGLKGDQVLKCPMAFGPKVPIDIVRNDDLP